METLYEQLITLLKEIPALKWHDLNVGQLDQEKPPVAFPCALIDIKVPKRDDIDTKNQQVSAVFSITLAVKAYGDTNGTVSSETRANSLEYFTVMNAIYKKLQGFTNDSFYPFSCTNQQPITKKGLKVMLQVFETSWNDYTASS